MGIIWRESIDIAEKSALKSPQIKFANFENYTSRERENIAPQSREILPFVGGTNKCL